MKQLKQLILFFLCLISGVEAPAQHGYFISPDRFSSSLISDLCQDKLGSIWIATDYGLNRYDGYEFQTFLHEEGDTTSLQANTVTCLLCDREGRLWVGTNRGLDRFDEATESFVHYPIPDSQNPRVSSLLQRHDGTLLVGTAGYGAYVLADDGRLHHFSTNDANSYFSLIFEDSQNQLWCSGFDERITLSKGDKLQDYHSLAGNPQGFAELDGELLILCQHGLMSYRDGKMSVADVNMSAANAKDVVFTNLCMGSDNSIYIGTRGKGIYRVSNSRPRRLEPVNIDALGIDPKTVKISATLFDRSGNMWLGCHQKGLLIVPQRPVQFNSWSFASRGILLGSTISSVCEGDDGMVWCTVQGVGVYGFNRQGYVVAHPSAPDAVEFIFRDRLKRYWVGTDDGLFAYNPLTGSSELKVTFECDKFNDMTSDNEGNIYISTFSRGFCVYNPRTGTLKNHSFNDTDSVRGRLCNNWVMGMSSDRQGLIWMATASGVACYDPQKDSFRSQGWESLLNGIMCFDVCELRSGQLDGKQQLSGCVAIGTEQGLYLYDAKTRQVERFPGSEQLANKTISYIVQSNDGDIWCSTSHGIWQYSLKTQSFIGHVSDNGLTQKEYIYGVGMHTDDDIVYFGHNDGLTVFLPKNVKESASSLDTLRLTAFRAGDEYVNARTILNNVQVTDKAVFESEQFTLSYLDHTVTLAFSMFNFDNPKNVTYEYRVNSGHWVSNPAGKNDFTLGHLQPGVYRIEVRAHQGNDYTPVKVVVVNVRAPWYRSMTAYFIYLLIFLTLAAYMFYMYRRRASEQLNEEKMKFLINATHDIRSPLTIILSALKKLKNQLQQSENTSDVVSTIEHNSQRILNLVNQILDVRKIDKQQMRLHCEPTELVGFVSGVCKMFDFNARERNIKFEFLHEGFEELEAWVDRSQFDKVVSNLLSNAFKYSKEEGEVTVCLQKTASPSAMKEGAAPDTGTTATGNFVLSVMDNGVGMDSETLRHVFDRFYQGSNSRRTNVEGTGIGLNLCKMIVDMHHGTITAQNRSDGKRGSVFTVTLPLGNAHLKPFEMANSETAPAGTVKHAAINSARRRVLVVDDDQEIGRYISSELGRYYNFGLCPNGKEGLKELLTGDEYDVVISDVMMPEMDGFTMLRMIKTNLNISHIPVIMLTSMDDVGNRLQGLERGADAYLGKPFDMDELHLTIDNLIQSRQRLKGKFSGAQQQAERLEQPDVKGNDEQLMERVMKVINKNLSDSDFNVEMLSREAGISRAQLHRRMKEMTGLSTSEFIRNIRLEQAARLLKEQKVNVTQVAYIVGFSNLAHFSTIFRKHFGVAPSEYVKSENS